MNKLKNFMNAFCFATAFVVLVNSALPTIIQGRSEKDTSVRTVTQMTSPVRNLPEDPLWIRDVNEAIQPVTNQIFATFNNGAPTASAAFPVVPAGKRLVIEHVSVYGAVPIGQKFFATIKRENNTYHALVLQPQVSFTNYDYFTASQPVKLYFEAGTSPQAFANRNSTSGSSNLIFTISGYYVDVP